MKWVSVLGLVVACSGGSSHPTDAGQTDTATDATIDPTVDAMPVVADLTVALGGAGSGRVWSLPAGIDCGATCTAGFTETVVLTGTPMPGSVLAGWSDASCQGGTCSVEHASLPRTITADFEPFVTTDVTLSPGNVDYGTVEVGASATRTFVLQNNSPYPVPIDRVNLDTELTLAGTTTCGGVLASGSSCNYDVTLTPTSYGDAYGELSVVIAGTIYASQIIATQVALVAVTVDGQGVVTSDPSGIDCGTTCSAGFAGVPTLTASPLPGNVFTGWGGTTCTTHICEVVPGSSVTAMFTPAPEYTVSVTVSGLTSSGLVLQDNGGDDLLVSADGTYVFATPVTSTWTYDVTVSHQPIDTTIGCRVDNATGVIGSSNVTANVTCEPHMWTAISISEDYRCALKRDGTLWCWTGLDLPEQFGTSSSWTAATVGTYGDVTCGLQGSALYCWGDNTHGSLGNGTTGGSSATAVEVDTGWSAVGVGNAFVCAIHTDGTLWCWGLNANGQLGDGTYVDKDVPTRVGTSSTWASLSSGYGHTCALDTAGHLWCWGVNHFGQLGDGSMNEHARPEQIGTATWQTVRAGPDYNCAIKNDGTLWCWGRNAYATLGDGTSTRALVPIQIGSATNWATLGPGDYGNCATRSDHSLWCWGSFSVGDGIEWDGTNPRLTPVQIAPATSWASAAMGESGACALALDSTLWCWGGISEFVPTEVEP